MSPFVPTPPAPADAIAFTDRSPQSALPSPQWLLFIDAIAVLILIAVAWSAPAFLAADGTEPVFAAALIMAFGMYADRNRRPRSLALVGNLSQGFAVFSLSLGVGALAQWMQAHTSFGARFGSWTKGLLVVGLLLIVLGGQRLWRLLRVAPAAPASSTAD